MLVVRAAVTGTATTAPPDVALASPPTVDVTFLANEGVLLSAGETRVVIDGLFRPYKTYAVMPAADRERLETSQPPFDGIDLVLVSHMQATISMRSPSRGTFVRTRRRRW